jgi:hypothetical protein
LVKEISVQISEQGMQKIKVLKERQKNKTLIS